MLRKMYGIILTYTRLWTDSRLGLNYPMWWL